MSKSMNETMSNAARRGTAFLEDIAGTATTSAQVAELLDEVCQTTNDWACVFLALANWDNDNKHVAVAIDGITEAAKDFCADWIERHD